MSTLTPKFAGFWAAMRDPQVRSALYVWLIVGGLCVMLANTLAATY